MTGLGCHLPPLGTEAVTAGEPPEEPAGPANRLAALQASCLEQAGVFELEELLGHKRGSDRILNVLVNVTY